MDIQMKDQMREVFEAMASSHGQFSRAVTRSGDGYLISGINHDWNVFQQAWLAALSSVQAQEPAMKEDIDTARHNEWLARMGKLSSQDQQPSQEPVGEVEYTGELSEAQIDYPRNVFSALICGDSPYAFYLFQWVPYQTEAKLRRLKMRHDVKTFDGRIELGIWPNADRCGSFNDSEVEFIRISKDQSYHEYQDPMDKPQHARNWGSE